ncbi:MAG: methylmalonyl Co-A mutase-associated GTPase MeaB [Candidatus Helarchaeota archaeon]
MKQKETLDELIARFLKHDKQALARIITLMENNSADARTILSRLSKQTNDAYIIGITGSPGTGKSTLIAQLAALLASQGFSVGIISIDPSSPIYGGAFLGDRVRMHKIILHPKVFIRSIASRGSTGGISKALYDIIRLYDAYEMDYILIETVGAGQTEVDIFNLAYTIVLLTIPETGDNVQVLKAGLLEIADIFVINKSDLGGDWDKINLNMMLQSVQETFDWRPPIVRTVATENKGIIELLQAIQSHRAHLNCSGKLKSKKRTIVRKRLHTLLETFLFEEFVQKLLPKRELEATIDAILNGTKDIYTIVHEILEPVRKNLTKQAER